MIKQDIITQSYELGQIADRHGLYVNRGNLYQAEYRLGTGNGRERVSLSLGFMAHQSAMHSLDNLKIVDIELFDSNDESFSIRVLADSEDNMYEDPYVALVSATLKRCIENETPVIATKRRVTRGQVERSLRPQQLAAELSVPILVSTIRFGLTA